MGRTIRARTLPVGPPETVTHSSSISGFSISPDCTSSTAFRPSAGGSSKRKGGLAVASANAAAAGSRTGRVGSKVSDMWISRWWCDVVRCEARDTWCSHVIRGVLGEIAWCVE